jgi:hypothetical protein
MSKPLVYRRRRFCGLIDPRKRKGLVQESIIYQASRSSFPNENPDWRQSYKHIKKWPDEAIAFEFLRRNVAYWDLVRQLYSLPEDPMCWPRLRLETTAGLLPDAITYQKLTKLAAKQFGVFNCCDPRLPCFDQGLWTVEASISARYTYSTVLGLADGALQYRFTQPPKNTVTIDLLADGPIEPQIDYVRWILANTRKKLGLEHRKAPRPQRLLMPDYLRLLDAKNEGAGNSTVAKYLYPKNDSAIELVRKRYAAAKTMRNGGYRNLLLWGKIEGPDLFLKSASPS